MPAYTHRVHKVKWNVERYGEVWLHDTNVQLTGDPAQDWQIIIQWATGSTLNVQARGEEIYRGVNDVELIPVEPPPTGGGN